MLRAKNARFFLAISHAPHIINSMKNIGIGILFVGAVAVAGWYFYSTQFTPTQLSVNSPHAPRPNEVSRHFQTQLFAAVSKKMQIQVDRADANLLVTAIPGLEERDFVSVVTKNGIYELRGGSLAFVLEGNAPASNLQTIIADGGYRTLLINVASRLAMPADSAESVNAIIAKLTTEEKGE